MAKRKIEEYEAIRPELSHDVIRQILPHIPTKTAFGISLLSKSNQFEGAWCSGREIDLDEGKPKANLDASIHFTNVLKRYLKFRTDERISKDHHSDQSSLHKFRVRMAMDDPVREDILEELLNGFSKERSLRVLDLSCLSKPRRLLFKTLLNMNSLTSLSLESVPIGADDIDTPYDSSRISTTGAGFNSKQAFGSGWFNMRIKVPVRDCAGIVVAFYLRSQGVNNQDEVDFEFLGNRPNKSITLQTNVITNGYNKREQRSLFWFDPTADFHDYKILWNHHQIVFYIDDIPIRVFRNNKKIGVSYLTRPMEIVASIWDGSDWATDGGQTKANYSHQPFRAYFRKFDIHACPVDRSKTDVRECYATRYLWNHRSLRQLNATEQATYDRVRREYMNYDYCANPGRFPEGLPKECTPIGSPNQYNGAT